MPNDKAILTALRARLREVAVVQVAAAAGVSERTIHKTLAAGQIGRATTRSGLIRALGLTTTTTEVKP